MRSGLIAAGCFLVLLLSKHEATELVPTYVAVLALPLASSMSSISHSKANPLAAAVALAATLAITWRPFEFVSAAVTAVVSAACASIM